MRTPPSPGLYAAAGIIGGSNVFRPADVRAFIKKRAKKNR
jgi:hypothetical protein